MKNFSELLATELYLDVVVNNKQGRSGLHDVLTFDVNHTVTIDTIEILPKYNYLAKDGVLTIDQPFYQWLHHVTAQGWLLEPNQ
jgi:hypothetical protein